MSQDAKGKKYQVFISSTYEDLKEERLAVSQVVLDSGNIPVGMEQFPASNMSQMKYIEKMLENCDYYILILGGRYGSIDPTDNKGYTEKEYDYAIERGIPVMSFIVEDIEKLPYAKCEKNNDGREALERFRQKVSRRMRNTYSSIGELTTKVAVSLHQCIEDYPRVGWVRGDDIEAFTHGLSRYTDSQITDLMYKVNDATRRALCIELVTTNKAQELIEECISIMRNNAEKYKLLEQLVKRGYADTDYSQSLFSSLDNGKYQSDALKLCIETKQSESRIEECFLMIENNKYIYQSLITIYKYDAVLFHKLYRNGECFSNDTYVRKMQEWMANQI